MKRSIAYIIGLSYLFPVLTVMQYPAKTSLYRRLEADRPAVEQRVRENQTSRDDFNKFAYDPNILHLGECFDAYLCQPKIDTTKCRSAFTF
jgi:hypothetical protein